MWIFHATFQLSFLANAVAVTKKKYFFFFFGCLDAEIQGIVSQEQFLKVHTFRDTHTEKC